MSKVLLVCRNCAFRVVRTTDMLGDIMLCPDCWKVLEQVSTRDKPTYWNDATDPCWYCGEDHPSDGTCAEARRAGDEEHG